MKLFCLSSLEALMSLLLYELGWWGTMFLGQYLPFVVRILSHFLFAGYQFSRLLRFRTLNVFIYAGLLLIRLIPGSILLVTVLKNRVNEHSLILKIWFWLSLTLDVLLAAYHLGFSLLMVIKLGSPWTLIGYTLLALLPFLVLKGLFWGVGGGVVRELSLKESSLFPTPGFKGLSAYLATQTESLLRVLLSWEIIWSSTLLLSLITRRFGSFIIPDEGWATVIPPTLLPLTFSETLYELVGQLAFTTLGSIGLILLGMSCKRFLRGWVVVYGAGVVAYGIFSAGVLILGFQENGHVLELVMAGLLLAGQMAFKLILLFAMLKYLSTGNKEDEDDEDIDEVFERELFLHPLLPTQIKEGKDPQ